MAVVVAEDGEAGGGEGEVAGGDGGEAEVGGGEDAEEVAVGEDGGPAGGIEARTSLARWATSWRVSPLGTGPVQMVQSGPWIFLISSRVRPLRSP